MITISKNPFQLIAFMRLLAKISCEPADMPVFIMQEDEASFILQSDNQIFINRITNFLNNSK